MPGLDLVTELYAYNRWANQRVLDTAEMLTSEQWLASVGASFPSVRDTLVHTMQVQYNWLHRFQEKTMPASMDPGGFPDLAAIRAAWNPIDEETDNYIISLKETALPQIIEYVNSHGVLCRYTRWQMLLHQVNHATQHRSEVAVMLTHFGYSPGWLDYLVYIDEQGTAR